MHPYVITVLITTRNLYLYQSNFYSRAYRFIYYGVNTSSVAFQESETDKVAIARSNKSERKEKMARKKKRNRQKIKFITQVRNISIFHNMIYLKFTSRYFCIFLECFIRSSRNIIFLLFLLLCS